MKKVLVFLMLLLSTSMVMAQFGSLKELKENEKQGGTESSSTHENPTNSSQNDYNSQASDVQLIEKSIANGFFLVRQEYQLEEKANPGSRYNWGEEQFFDYRVSFMVKLNNGFITTNSIVSPWAEEDEEDNKFTQYQNTYNPVFSKTSTMKVGQKGWKTEGKVFQPKEEGDLFGGLKFVKDNEWAGDGFLRASGYGKKEVYVVWMLADIEQQEYTSISFCIEYLEVDIKEGKNNIEASAPEKSYHHNAIGGIVVEPVFKGVGRMELALVGVIDNSKKEQPDNESNQWHFDVSILGQNMGEAIDSSNDKSLTPTEDPNSGDKNNNKKSSN